MTEDAPDRVPAWPKWIVTVGGSGLSPVAPGTMGSLATTVVLGIVFALMGTHVDVWAWNGVLVAGLVIFSALCVVFGPWTGRYFAKKDPGPCVLDEAAGICLTALFLPIYPGWRQLWTLAAVFAAFRLFDIVKLWPARRLEKLPLGWGILMDDLAAAVYANLVCQVVLRLAM